MQEDDDVVFRGKLADCLRHFGLALNAKYPPGQKGVERMRQPMATFCGISYAAVRHWLKGDILPRGLYWFRLACFVELHDYQVIELERVGRHRRNLIELLAYGVVTPEDMAKQLAYSAAWGVYDALKYRTELSAELAEKYWNFYAPYKAALEQKKQEARQKYRIDLTRTTAPTVPESVPIVQKEVVTAPVRGIFIAMQGMKLQLEEQRVVLQPLNRREREILLGLSGLLSTLSAEAMASTEGVRNGG